MKQEIGMDVFGTRRLLKMLAVVMLSLTLAACGADDDGDEAEETPDASDAQPTLEVTEAPPESPAATIPADDDPGTPVANNVETTISTPVATPEADAPDVATPDVAMPMTPDVVPSTPVADGPEQSATPEMDMATPEGDPINGTQADESTGDGTTGADVQLPDASPTVQSATPEPNGATPEATSATPQAESGELLSVSGCVVETVPPFEGEQTTYQLTVDINFRTGPGTDCDLALEDPIGEFQQVDVIGGPVLREDDGTEWVQITVLGTEGWVAFEFLEPVE